MKLLFITGSYPPDKCAMGDTSLIQINILKRKNIETELLTHIDWSLTNLFNILRSIKNANADVFYMHYPTMGYKHSIVPQIISLVYRKKIVVIIHEVSQAFIVRKISLLPFSFGCNIVFTNQYEKKFFKKIFPWTSNKKTEIIPIGSNIKAFVNDNFDDRNKTNIVYFGQIRQNKGIEEIIELAKIIKARNLNFNILVTGRKLSSAIDFYNRLTELSSTLPIELKVDLDEFEVSRILGSNSIAYMPFPDGASERRGSLFAALVHRMIVFTTRGSQTPEELNNCIKFVATPEKFIDILNATDFNDYLYRCNNELQPNIEAFLNNYTWDTIMDKYITKFKKISNTQNG